MRRVESNNKKLASVNTLYKKVDKPIELVELTEFDQEHKDQFYALALPC